MLLIQVITRGGKSVISELHHFPKILNKLFKDVMKASSR